MKKKGKDVYNGMFLSVSGTQDSSDLPLVLVFGSLMNNIHTIHGLIENMFKCLVRQLKLSETQTFWLMGEIILYYCKLYLFFKLDTHIM